MTLDKTFQSKDVEKKYYEVWEKSGVFAANVKSNKAPYTIPMPPPNVTGSLHMGHALNMTLQDILSRYERMQGKDVLWQPGTDHAGIATQMVVERKLAAEGKSRHDFGREGFIEKVWEWKKESGSIITNQVRRLGATPDWERERFTMDEGLNKAVRKVFVQLYKEKLIYKDKRLVNWDPKLHTAISDLEVEQKETKGSMWHFRYPVEGNKERFIVIATTRPETMLGDTAIAVHPDDERYKDLVGKFAVLPIVGRIIPIIADEYADPEKGSGAVKITPAHDFNDFEVGKRHNLPMIDVLDKHAKVNQNAPEEYQGLDRYEARKKILAEMEALELIEKVDNIVNMVPYGDRSGVVLEPLLTDQWYVDAKTLAQPAIKAVEDGRTQFIPANWTKTYYEWMRNIQPWCISRQIWWGHQIPAWYDDNGKVYVAETEEEAQAQAGKGVKLTRDADVLDTWFSSALWPFSTLGWPDKTEEVKRYYPAETLITGFDIIFFWVARMMMMGIHFMGDVPFRKVYIHALVRDEKGQKMSKSKGNIIDPLELIDEYGSDALRFTLTALAAQGRDVKLSPQRVEGYRNFTTKLWNAARFCEMNGCVLNPAYKPENAKHIINKWVISELAAVAAETAKSLDVFRFNDTASNLYHFTYGTFCDWYIEFTKPLLNGTDEALKTEVRETTGWVLDKLLLLLNPIMPYVTEELHAHLLGKSEPSKDKNDWLMTQAWPVFDNKIIDKAAQDEMNWVVRLISEIRSLRAFMNVPASAKVPLGVKNADETTKERLKKYSGLIQTLARMPEYQILEEKDGAYENMILTSEGQFNLDEGAASFIHSNVTMLIPLADFVDIDQERARLKKEIDKVSQSIEKINKMLSNPGFLAKAPEEVVEEQKETVREAENVRSKLHQALKQIEAA